MLIQLAVEVTEEAIQKVVNDLTTFQLQLTPPGILLHKLAEEVSDGGPLHICETGCLRDQNPTAMMTDGWSSIYFARYVKDHPGSKLTTIELDRTNLGYCLLTLGRYGYTENVNLVHGESVATITDMKEHPDLFYLDSCDGLEHGLAELKAALAHNPKLIVMDDYISKVSMAAEFAAKENIPMVQMGRYSTFLTSPEAIKKFSSVSVS
jgi:hypothetical protein